MQNFVCYQIMVKYGIMVNQILGYFPHWIAEKTVDPCKLSAHLNSVLDNLGRLFLTNIQFAVEKLPSTGAAL